MIKAKICEWCGEEIEGECEVLSGWRKWHKIPYRHYAHRFHPECYKKYRMKALTSLGIGIAAVVLFEELGRYLTSSTSKEEINKAFEESKQEAKE